MIEKNTNEMEVHERWTNEMKKTHPIAPFEQKEYKNIRSKTTWFISIDWATFMIKTKKTIKKTLYHFFYNLEK